MSHGIGILGDQLKRHRVGLVLALALFVLYYAALQIERFLIQRAKKESHAVRLHPQGVIEGGGRNILEIVGSVVVGGAVQIGGADLFHGVDVASRRMLAAAKHKMFEEMRESRFAEFLVLRPHVVPRIDGHDGRLVVFVDDDRQSVIQYEFLKWNIDVLGLRQGASGQKYG